jgi:hypothetical protein
VSVNCSAGFAVIGASSICKRREQSLRQYSEHGYDTANVYRNHFGATLVEDPVRHIALAICWKVNAAPRKRGRIFFIPVFVTVVFKRVVAAAAAGRSASRRKQWSRYVCQMVQFDSTITP